MQATGFIHQLESPSFLISFQIRLECLTHLRGFTVKLQVQALDALFAYKQVSSVHSSLVSMRERSDTTFSRIFKDTTALAKHLQCGDYE